MKSVKITRVKSKGTKVEVNRKNVRSRKNIEPVEEEEEEEVSEASVDEGDDVLRNNESNSEESNDNESEEKDSEPVLNKEEVSEESADEGGDVLRNKESSEESDDNESEGKDSPVPKRKKRKTKYNAVEEARLERLVFGDPSDVINNLMGNDKTSSDNVAQNDTSLKHVTDLMEDSEDSVSDYEENKDSDNDYSDASKGCNAAWVDDDDVQYSVDVALKAQNRKLPSGRPEKVYSQLLETKFSQIIGSPKWASLTTRDEDADSDNEILKHSNHLAVEKVKKLRKGIIDIKALTDINKSTHTEGPVVSSLEFHPTSTVALVAGLSGILSLFQIDGRENTKLHSIQFEKFRINCGKFLKEGTEVMLGSRYHSYSQAYDLMSGKTYRIPLPHGITNMQKFEVSPDGKLIAIAGRMGQIHLLSGTTKELVANLKMNKRCHSLAFSPDSSKLITHGDSEEMYIWDLKSRSCIHKAIDNGCIANASLALSPSGQFLATGSKQAAVNIYETESVLQQRNPSPLKIILNLVTPITSLKFNPTSEILAMASSLKENAFKMVHLPSFTVFANFPTFQTKMYQPLDIDFSPNSGYLGLSNNKGHAYLYRLKHFGNY